jgi:predicted phosphohydrolase
MFTMKIFAIADLHLSFSTPGKSMDIFGEAWINHPEKVKKNWLELIGPEDLVLIPGDISWAKPLEDAIPDLQWIEDLPGTKVLTKGNHDYWWPSASKLAALPFKTLHFIQHDSFNMGDISIAGTRLWDTPEYDFSEFYPSLPIINHPPKPDDAKIFQRELLRLEESLKTLSQNAAIRIAMVHYPPIGPDLKSSLTSDLLEKYKIDICVFGHLHGLTKEIPFGKMGGVSYHLVSCDYLKCKPLRIL